MITLYMSLEIFMQYQIELNLELFNRLLAIPNRPIYILTHKVEIYGS